eukprot:08634.XXX_553992_554162_1 [CDS] Oithona nana genome sequencing.
MVSRTVDSSINKHRFPNFLTSISIMNMAIKMELGLDTFSHFIEQVFASLWIRRIVA